MNFKTIVLRMLPALALLLQVTDASAQTKPYQPLSVTYNRAIADDPSLKSTLENLRLAIATKKLDLIDAALSPNVAVIECDANPTKPCSTSVKGAVHSNSRLPAPERLRQALCCLDIAAGKITPALRNETVLGLIGAALEEDTLGSHPDLPGYACLPAWPLFDLAKAAAIAKAADIEPDNLRVSTIELVLRAKPDTQAPEIARFAIGQMVPLVTDLPETLPDGWTAIALPQGGYGYTDQLGLNEIAPGGLCLMKNAGGQWVLRRDEPLG